MNDCLELVKVLRSRNIRHLSQLQSNLKVLHPLSNQVLIFFDFHYSTASRSSVATFTSDDDDDIEDFVDVPSLKKCKTKE